MPELRDYLAQLDRDPHDDQVIAAIEGMGDTLASDDAADALKSVRDTLRERGELEVVARLFDVEINASTDNNRRADLLMEKGHLYIDDLLEEESGVACFNQVLELSPGHEDATEALEDLELVRENWEKLVEKYVDEAAASTDRSLTTHMYQKAAETYARYKPGADEIEGYLRKALEVDPRNRKVATHLERLFRRDSRWEQLAELMTNRIDNASTKDERIAALVNLADIAQNRLEDSERSVDAMKQVIATEPAHPRALSMLSDVYERDENWSALVMLYTNALKARRRGASPDVEIGMLLQIAMLHWKRLDNVDAAEEYFRRLRKLAPAHPAALEFYRGYFPARGETNKLVQALRHALKGVGDDEPDTRRRLQVEIAELAETEMGNPGKAIDAWKAILRNESDAADARVALKRLYAVTEKWNALLDLMKDEVERLDKDDVAGRVAGLTEIVEIYRDRLKLDPMVINTYHTILTLDPDSEQALDALAAKYEQLGRWNDLIVVLGRKAESPNTNAEQRVSILQEIAALWIDRFGNFAQAIKPLEQLLELAPAGSVQMADTVARLKEIYTRRRQWRALIALLGREAEMMPLEQRREHLAHMASIASDRLGDARLAIQVWNRVLELPAPADAATAVDPLGPLANLYEREKRYPALAEVFRRQRQRAKTDAEAIQILERLGALLSDRVRDHRQAAEIYQEILALDDKHPRALRLMRELYASVGEYETLERVYADLGQWGELVDAFYGIADRLDDRDAKLKLLERSAEIAFERFDNKERIARCYERILSVDPAHRGAARKLVDVYKATQKWSRLLSVQQILLEHAETDDERFDIITSVRQLCEKHLGSKSLAFQWTARAYELRPDDTELLADLERIGAEADAWEEVAAILGRRAEDEDTPEQEKLRLYRELGKIASVRLHKPDLAQDYLNRVLALKKDDADAMASLEEIATQQSEWPQLLEIYRRKVSLARKAENKTDLLFKIAVIEEERVADIDAAAATYRKILEIDGESRRALKALAKLNEARGDWAGLAEVLERELGLAADDDTKIALHLRLGTLYENSLDRRTDALAGYKEALALGGSNAVYAALERFIDDPGDDPRVRIDVARLLLPEYEDSGDPRNIARVLEILREDADEVERLETDRRLVKLFRQLERTQDAYDAALRVLEADFADPDNRAEMIVLSETLEVEDILASELQNALDRSREADADPGARRALATELAVVYEERINNLEAAEKAWKEVLDIEATDGAAYDALDRIYRGAGMWSELRELLERRADNTFDSERRKDTLLAICDLNDGVLDDPDAAIDSYRRVLEVDPDMLGAYKALERLYEQKERWRDLEDLLARELDHVDEDEQINFLVRRAYLRALKLEDVVGAVDICEDVIGRRSDQPGARSLLEDLLDNADVRQRVARVLEPLYETEENWRELVSVLRVQREAAESHHEVVDLLARIATLESDQLGENTSAFGTWVDAMDADPTDERPRVAILMLAAELSLWSQAADALLRALNAVGGADISLQTDVASALARIYDEELRDAANAIIAYEKLLALDPGNPETGGNAAAALARLYEQAESWPQLTAILRRQAEWANTPEQRSEILARVAALAEIELEDEGAAISTWNEVLNEYPEHAEALNSLERLYEASGSWIELTEVLRRRVDLAEEPEAKKTHLARIASLFETQIDSPSDAVTARLEILDYLPEDDGTLVELSRLYRQQERYGDLQDILERRLALAYEADAMVELFFSLAELLREHLGRDSEALERYADVLTKNPDHSAATQAVERYLDDRDLLRRAAEILEPLYEGAADNEKLANLLERVADQIDDPRTRIQNLRRVAETREGALDDKAGAFEAMRKAVKLALSEPDLPDMLRNLERLASQLAREGDLIDVYTEIVPDVFDGELQRRLMLDIADLARAVRNDVDLARDNYQRVLDMQPDDRRALSALENIYRLQEEWDRLFDILQRKADLAGNDFDARAKALDESARLCAEHLDRPEEAIAAWEQVLELTPENRAAADALQVIYEGSERWHDLSDLLERRLGFAFTVEEAVRLRFKLGKLYEERLHDPDAAVENYSAALGGDPGHMEATKALEKFLDDPGTRNAAAEVLEPIYVSRQDWPRLVRIYEIKLEAADDPDERMMLTRYIARLMEDQLEDLEGAFRWYGRVFREDPGDEGVRAQLVRLAGVLELWSSLANVYQEFLDDTPEDNDDVRAVALAVAGIYDFRLGSVDRAHAAYRRVLGASPDDVGTFTLLEDLLTRAERWHDLVESYEEAIQATMNDALRIDLYMRMAGVLESRLDEPERSIDAFRAILDIEPDDRRALDELDRLFNTNSKWYELADHLRARIEATEGGEQHSFRLRLASLLETRLEDIAGAIDQLEILLENSVYAAVAELERLVVRDEHKERIASLLEPVYRDADEWKKLVVILGAQLEFVEDPTRRVAMLREIARIHETRGGDALLALDALSKAWHVDISDQEVYDELLALAAKLGEWDKLVETLEQGVKDVFDTDLVANVLSRVAEIHEANRDDSEAAIDAWRRVLEVRDDDMNALAALDTLLDGARLYKELVKVIERRAELSSDPGIRKMLLQRVAGLYEEFLSDRAMAISAHKRVLDVDEEDLEALDSLERLYRTEKDYRALAEILNRKIELATAIDDRRPLQFALASVYETHLTDPYEAIAQMNNVLEEAPDDREALAALDGLYKRESMWNELLETLDRRAEVEHEVEDVAKLRYRSARLVLDEMLEPEEAIRRFASVLEIAPSHERTREELHDLTKNEDTLAMAADVLEKLYRSESNDDALAELYETRLGQTNADPVTRQSQFATLADIHETSRGDVAAAFQVWARALAEAPEDESVQGQLERLTASRGNWEDLAGLYEARLVDTVDADLEYYYATKLGSLYEEAIGDLDRAADKFRQALGASTDELAALAALARIYDRAGKYQELSEILSRQSEASLDEDRQAELLFRLGDIRENQLGLLPDAVQAYSDVLERDPHHVAARGALERMLGHESERANIVSILEPLYEGESDIGRLADLLVTKLTITDDSLGRAQIYARITELAENRLGDPTRALDAAGGWLEEDPLSEEALGEVERLAEIVGRWGDVAARLSGIVAATDAVDARRPLTIKLGVIQLEKLGDLDSAEQTFLSVLEDDAENADALVRLDQIYRQRGDIDALCTILERRGELAFDAQLKRNCFAEVALLREQTGDSEAAVAAWRQVLDIEEGDREAHNTLSAILEREHRWEELIEILIIAARFAEAAEVDVRARIATIYTDTLDDLERGAESWQAVLDLDPDHRAALTALEIVHSRREDWLAVQEVLSRQLDAADNADDQIVLLQKLARVAADGRESIDEAVGYLQQILDVDNAHMQTYDQLQAMLRKSERWHELVDLLDRIADVRGTMGDTDGEVRALAEAADVWEGPLENPDAAGEILEKILRRQPDFVPALTRLAKIYEGTSDWDKCGEILQKALSLGPTGRDAADLYYRLGEVARNQSGDTNEAAGHFAKALEYDALHSGAVAALEEYARDNDDWGMVADMVRRRLDSAQGDERLELTLELADLYSKKLGAPDAVIPLLESAAQTAPDDPRVIGPLADVYFAAGRHAEAAPMFETLAEEAKKSRRMKDVAKYRQRLGGILEAQGNADGALVAYEEAFRIDPTNVTTMAGLGRIYMERQNWEKSRRVYRSMVLQNIDPDTGLTKAIVYYNLGLIHMHLNEPRKAKGMLQRGLELEPHNPAIKQALAGLD